jgi:3-hexulose-6-phosphate synthase
MGPIMSREDLLKKISQGPLLQVALDIVDLDLASRIARDAAKVGFDIVEVGTPLLKAYGSTAISRIRELAEGSIVMVDTKTTDAGGLEAEIVAKAGGDAMSVLALSSDEVIQETISRARDLDLSAWVDMIHIQDPLKRAEELRILDPDILVIHVGVDVQRRKGITVEALEKIIIEAVERGFRVAVAGGIRGESIKRMASIGASIIVIGGWITKHHDPVERMREAIRILRG